MSPHNNTFRPEVTVRICRFQYKNEIFWGEYSQSHVKQLEMRLDDEVTFLPTKNTFPIEQITLLTPLASNTIWGIGDNFPRYSGDDRLPQIFRKSSQSLTSHNSVVKIQAGFKTWGEPEIGIIVKRRGKNLKNFNPDEFILGYVLVNDITRLPHDGPQDSHAPEAKNQPGFCPLGMIIETEFDYESCLIEGSVNGVTYRSGKLSATKWKLKTILEKVSQIHELKPLDMIHTGCPPRVNPVPSFLKDGDVFEVSATKLGILRNTFQME